MIHITRRTLLAGAVALPAVVGTGRWAIPARSPGCSSEESVVIFDPFLFTASLLMGNAGTKQIAIEGDRILLMKDVLSANPRVVVGHTRYADFLLLTDVGRELGYQLLASARLKSGEIEGTDERPGWQGLTSLAERMLASNGRPAPVSSNPVLGSWCTTIAACSTRADDHGMSIVWSLST